MDTEEEVTYTIVGVTESNLDKGLISVGSPLSKQLMGKKQGDEVMVTLPSGQQEYEVLSVGFQPIVF
jgi:transcription elongation factor GreA